MGFLHRFFNRILPLRWRKPRPEDIPKRLDAATLARVMQEARFLHAGHSVDVRSLEPGETPGLPRRADGVDATESPVEPLVTPERESGL